jgi:hypothetical protein
VASPRRGRAGRRRELNRSIRAALLFLEVPDERLRVIAVLAEQLLAMAMQLFHNRIINHGWTRFYLLYVLRSGHRPKSVHPVVTA